MVNFMQLVTALSLLSCLYIDTSLGYKILLLCPSATRSHSVLIKAKADILHSKGHEVTIITGYSTGRQNVSKYEEILIPELATMRSNHNGFEITNYGHFILSLGSLFLTLHVTDLVFANSDFVDMLTDKKRTFDLVIFEDLLSEHFIGLGVHFACPVILTSSTVPPHSLARLSGNSPAATTVSHQYQAFAQRDMARNVFHRAANTVSVIVDEILYQILMLPLQRYLYQKYFPNESRVFPFSELPRKVALVFLNTHPSIGEVRPLLPNTVEIAGFHLEDKPLPEDLRDILNSNDEGAIFFSLGGNLNMSHLPKELKSGLLKMFGELKQTVLWKLDEELAVPANVIIRKWFPQGSVLAHPNVRLFITHCGMLSLTEASGAGVPMVILPVYGDQRHNAEGARSRGQGVVVEASNFTAEAVRWAVHEVLNNDSYKKVAKQIQLSFFDRPMPAREMINFYSEHVIKTRGAGHLAPPDVGLLSILMLDVAAILLLPPLLILSILIYGCKRWRSWKSGLVKKND